MLKKGRLRAKRNDNSQRSVLLSQGYLVLLSYRCSTTLPLIPTQQGSMNFFLNIYVSIYRLPQAAGRQRVNLLFHPKLLDLTP